MDETQKVGLRRIKCSNRYGQVYTESSPLQRSIMEAFGIALLS